MTVFDFALGVMCAVGFALSLFGNPGALKRFQQSKISNDEREAALNEKREKSER